MSPEVVLQLFLSSDTRDGVTRATLSGANTRRIDDFQAQDLCPSSSLASWYCSHWQITQSSEIYIDKSVSRLSPGYFKVQIGAPLFENVESTPNHLVEHVLRQPGLKTF